MPIEIKVVRRARGYRQRLRAHAVPLRRDHHAGRALAHARGHGRGPARRARDRLCRRLPRVSAGSTSGRRRASPTTAPTCCARVEVARALYLEAGADGPARRRSSCGCDATPRSSGGRSPGFNRLGASFGSSMLERAVIDARRPPRRPRLFRAGAGRRPRHRPRRDHARARRARTREFLPERPLHRLHVRHTVGLLDPISAADVPRAGRRRPARDARGVSRRVTASAISRSRSAGARGRPRPPRGDRRPARRAGCARADLARRQRAVQGRSPTSSS